MYAIAASKPASSPPIELEVVKLLLVNFFWFEFSMDVEGDGALVDATVVEGDNVAEVSNVEAEVVQVVLVVLVVAAENVQV